MSTKNNAHGFGRNGQSMNQTSSQPNPDIQSERVRDNAVVPSSLYEVNDQGIYSVSAELDAIRASKVDPLLMPLEQIENVASESGAVEQLTSLATYIVDATRAGLLAAIDHDETYLDFKAEKLAEERKRLEAECLAVPYDTKERDPSAGWHSMEWLEIGGLVTAAIFFVGLATWTAASDLALVYDNLSIAYPNEAGEIDFSAMYGSDNAGAVPEAPKEIPIYHDTNAYKSIAILSVLFVLFGLLDVLKLAPLSSYREIPGGIFPKLRWLFTPLGLIFSVQVTLLVSAIAFNLLVGFELDTTASDIDPEPPISSATTYSLMAVALAFSVYALLHWVAQIFDRLCGVRLRANPKRLEMTKRIEALDLRLNSVVSILSCFKGLRSGHETSKKRFVAECLSVLAGIQKDNAMPPHWPKRRPNKLPQPPE